MIKILHFVSIMNRAGQETFIMNAYRNIDREQYQFNFLCSRAGKGDYDEEILELGGNIYHLPERENGNKYLAEIRRITTWLKNNRNTFDIVHVHTYHAADVVTHLEAFRRVGVKNVVIHSHNSNGPHPLFHKTMRILFPIYNFKKLACSEAAASWMYGKRAVDTGEVTIIYNGIDTAKFTYSEQTRLRLREELGLQEDIVLGHIGRFNYQKNHKFLIDCFSLYLKKHSNAKLVLVGTGELKDDIIDYAKTAGVYDSIYFMGVRADVEALLNAFDIFVFPSLYEGLSVVLIEAQCNGLNIISTDNLSPETIISDGMHLLPTESADLWAEAIDHYVGKRTKNIDYAKVDAKATTQTLVNVYNQLSLK